MSSLPLMLTQRSMLPHVPADRCPEGPIQLPLAPRRSGAGRPLEQDAVEPSDAESNDETPGVDHLREERRLVLDLEERGMNVEQLPAGLVTGRRGNFRDLGIALGDPIGPEMRSRNGQRRTRIAPQDPALHPAGR